MSRHNTHICGFYYTAPPSATYQPDRRKYLPLADLLVHSTIVSSTSRTVLTQNFVNTLTDKAIPELRYTFPLYDGVSVVGFTCTINKDRVIRGVVKERNAARQTYQGAVGRGETAGLLEQLPDASDVFTTTVGNVPAGAELEVEITYLGELKHDAETDGIRFTIPTSIAPRYGDYPGELLEGTNVSVKKGISIVVDAEMPQGSSIRSVQSPSHPISVTIGNTSIGASSGADVSLQKASATLSLGTAELDKDFVVQVVAADTSRPTAVLETHPTIPGQRAIMATLVPKFNLPPSRPEVVFVCDRSGSMDIGKRIRYLKAALQIFLKSLPLGVKFNICSFGSNHEFLFKNGSVAYDAAALKEATSYVDAFSANMGGTEMYKALQEVLEKRWKDMDLEVFLLTDGQVWNQSNLSGLVNKHVSDSKGATRVFTLGIGDAVSHTLVEGIARAGNGFAQTVMDGEKMNSKVIRMLKAAMTPHITDYTLEVKYGPEPEDDDDFEVVEKVFDALSIDVSDPAHEHNEKAAKGVDTPQKPISLFDPAIDPDAGMIGASLDTTAGGRYAGVPAISEPELLQAPFTIPPLFPFNRTSIYLLLSPETAQKIPESVMLRGTSKHGPLELEIPISILPQPAETIHQLAARKAIQDLEEGRGWIFHAKAIDSKPEGKLLKDIFQGRFSEMVEREAVRLGVTYQVGGKWCSFVAVEGKDQVTAHALREGKDLVRAPVSRALSDYQAQLAMLEQQKTKSFMTARQESDMVSFPISHSANTTLGGRPSTASGRNKTLRSTPYSITPRAARVNPAMQSSSWASLATPRNRVTRNTWSSIPRAASVQPAMQSLSAASPAPQLPVQMDHALQHAPAASEDSVTSQLGSRGVPESVPKPRFPVAKKKAPRRASDDEPMDDLEAIVALQTFEGYWEWQEDLWEKLGFDVEKALSSQPLAALGPGLNGKSEKLATAVVLAFLETKMANREDEWEMLAEKARDWLKANIGDGVAQDYLDVIKGLF